MWFPNRSDTNRPVQSKKRARRLKFGISVEEELYYPSSENKGADQLRGYREADLRLCFCLCRLIVFPCCGSYILSTEDDTIIECELMCVKCHEKTVLLPIQKQLVCKSAVYTAQLISTFVFAKLIVQPCL